jgi:breakpoint cluster region protein
LKIEKALHDCDRYSNGILSIESPSGDLKLKISLKYSKREGTFKRQGSKRSLAVFGKSIETLINTPNGWYVYKFSTTNKNVDFFLNFSIDGIPRIIQKCIEMVDTDGLKETGIYRVCCVTSDLQKLRHQFDRHYHRGEEMLVEKNVHVAANLLKLFFRELPEPLFTSALYKQFLHAIQLKDIDNQRVTLLKTLELLPSDNRKVLFHLLDHLIRVSHFSDINMMHLDNLAVVFGPTLMRPSKLIMTNYFSGSNQRLNAVGQTDLDQMSAELQGSMHQCEVVLACLKLRRDGLLK